MLKRLFKRLIAVMVVFVAILVFLAAKQSHGFRRDPVVLMNKYYRYKYVHPDAAQQALQLILNQNPDDLPAMIEWSQWLIETKNYHDALPLLERIHRRLPENEEYAYQLGYVYYEEGRWQDAFVLFSHQTDFTGTTWKVKANTALNAMASFLPSYRDEVQIFPVMLMKDDAFSSKPSCVSNVSLASTLSLTQKTAVNLPVNPLNRFYDLKKHDEKAAFRYIQHVLKRHPDNVNALKEAGFLAIKTKQTLLAIHYLSRAYQLTNDPALAMQLAYLYNEEHQNKLAYRTFEWARRTPDPQLAYRAETALTQLAGQQTKLLPEPYYGEFFAMPFTQSRFGLTVTQFIGRLGVEQTNRWQTKEYVFSQRTQDNQSRSYNTGKLSQIYEDDVQITGVGVQLSPFLNTPLLMYGEVGAAYDLIDRNRDRWRSDFRGGVMYYQTFGQKPNYYATPQVRPDYYSTWYADLTYFSRYNNNVIGLLKTHQGLRVFQYKSSLVNAYVRGFLVQDTKRLFYNNFAEIGPGIGFIPSNRYNVEVRFDYINGVYLPSGSSVNPYGKYYTNKLLQLLVYVKI